MDWTEAKIGYNEQKIAFQRDLMRNRGEKLDEKLYDKNIEVADRETTTQQTPEKVRTREEAAARCTKVNKRRVLKKEPRKARAEHLVLCW